MSSINLQKKSEKVKIQLAKHNIREKITLRVGSCLDKSGSAEPFYLSGRNKPESDMEQLMSRLLAVAHNFDDNGEIDSWIFSNDVIEMPPANASNYGTYVKDVIMGGKYKDWWQATSYAPAMKEITDFYFPGTVEKAKSFLGGMFSKKEAAPAASSDVPALVFFVTDGANDDKRATEQAIIDGQGKNIYWMMVGIGNPDYFTFIEQMADKYPNVGFVNFKNLDMDDEDMYDAILDGELSEWIKKVSKK